MAHPEGSPKSNATVVAALIGAVATIGAAGLTGYFALRPAPEVDAKDSIKKSMADGMRYFDENRLDLAADCFRTAVRLGDESGVRLAEAHDYLSIILQRQGRLSEAEQEVRTSISIDSTNAGAHNRLGDMLCMRREYEEGIREYKQAVALRPEVPDAYEGIGMACIALNDLQSAENAFLDAIDRDSKYAGAHYGLARVYALLYRDTDALRALETAISLQPRYREDAVDDPDFSGLRTTQAFRDLIAGY